MEIVKQTDEYTIFKKRSSRYAVQGKDKKWVNGEEKARILAAEELIKLSAPNPDTASSDAEAGEEAAEAAPEAEADGEASAS